MNAPVWLPKVVLFIGILLISLNFWYLVYIPKKKEGFDTNILSNAFVVKPEKPPTDTEVAIAYRTVLVYIKHNTLNGLKIINDFSKRVYGSSNPVPDSFDPRTIMDNFINPVTGM